MSESDTERESSHVEERHRELLAAIVRLQKISAITAEAMIMLAATTVAMSDITEETRSAAERVFGSLNRRLSES